MIEEKRENLLVELDDLQNKIVEAKSVIDRYEELKKEIKKSMSSISKENGIEQIKWTTPNGIKITFTAGHIASIEKEKVKELDVEKLKVFFGDIYDACLVEKERSVITKNATSDTLRITI